uniref:Uncharacterized protein n=1 Tax=Timema tahoe TaxID=61484 RepID=A0A7R9ICM8_9NEOP|nr:unnamed protein product [Timema tahoe]
MCKHQYLFQSADAADSDLQLGDVTESVVFCCSDSWVMQLTVFCIVTGQIDDAADSDLDGVVTRHAMSSLGAQVHDSLAAVGRAITGLNNKGNRDDQQTDGQDAIVSEVLKRSEIGSGGEDDDKQAVIPVPEPKTPSVQPSIVYQRLMEWIKIYRNYHSLGEAYTHMEKLTLTWRSLHSRGEAYTHMEKLTLTWRSLHSHGEAYTHTKELKLTWRSLHSHGES